MQVSAYTWIWTERCANQSFLGGGLQVNQLSRDWGLEMGVTEALISRICQSPLCKYPTHMPPDLRCQHDVTVKSGRDALSALPKPIWARSSTPWASAGPPPLLHSFLGGLRPLLWLCHILTSPSPSFFSSQHRCCSWEHVPISFLHLHPSLQVTFPGTWPMTRRNRKLTLLLWTLKRLLSVNKRHLLLTLQFSLLNPLTN